MIQVAFRVDASLDIGFGHVMRCLALAQALEQRGARCVFVCCAVPGHLGELIASRGHEIRLMPRTDHEWAGDRADYMVSILLAGPTNSMHLERVSLGLTLLAEIYASSGLRVDLTPDSDLNVGSLNPLGYVQVSPQQLYHDPGPL